MKKNESRYVFRLIASLTPEQRAAVAPMAEALRRNGIEPTMLILSPATARVIR